MPILPAEPDLYPADLWQGDRPPPDSDCRWWCLHTKPRQEKAVARELRVQGISYYLPQVIQENRTPQGRKTRSIMPLFRGYLFLLGNDHDRLGALKGNRLAKVLDVADQAEIANDLRQIHQMLSSGLAVVPEPSAPVGTKVRIKSGPLAGVKGTVIRRGKRDQFTAIVKFLGRGATVDLKDWQVEPVPNVQANGLFHKCYAGKRSAVKRGCCGPEQRCVKRTVDPADREITGVAVDERRSH